MQINNKEVIDIIGYDSELVNLYSNNIYFHNAICVLRRKEDITLEDIINLFAFISKATEISFDSVKLLETYAIKFGVF